MDETDEIDIDEAYEPIRPKAPEPPPLPRMWKDPDGAEPVEAVPSPKKKRTSAAEPSADRPKKKRRPDPYEDVLDDGTGAIKLEETPVLDTYETRQRVRWLIGTIIAVIFMGALVLGWKAANKGGPDESRDAENVEPRTTPELRGTAEQEARLMLDMARKADENGRTVVAIEQLTKLTKVYQGTAAAREAQHALDRHRQEMPLFGIDVPAPPGGPTASSPGTPSATGPVPPKNAVASNANPGTPRLPERSPPAPPTAPSNNATGPARSPTTAPDVAPTLPPGGFRPLPTGYRPKFEFPIHGSGWPTRIACDADGAELVLVPAATFLMGRDDGLDEEGPTHQVFVSTFYIDLHEVTVGQYVHYLKESGRSVDAAKLGPNNPALDDLPMVGITHKEAIAYLKWAQRQLPTEAQWELASRGPGLGKVSYWNGQLPRPDPAKGSRVMEPVMSLPIDVSPYGAFDLGANAHEWTADFFDSKYYQRHRNLVEDPTGPKTSPARIAEASVRGGSRSGYLTWRDGLKTETRLPYLGFRGALPVEGKPIAPVAKPAPNGGPGGLNGGVPPL